MHEVGIMQGAVKTILESMSQAGASRVTNVQLTVGRSGHFSEESVRNYFQLLTKDTPAEGAFIVYFMVTSNSTVSYMSASVQ